LGILPPRPDLRALRPRLLHAHFGRGGALALPIARALGIPLVVTFHGGDATKETHYRPRVVPRIYARRLAALQEYAALFVCVSEFVRDRLLARGFPPEKLEVIYQGVDEGGDIDAAPPGAPEAAADPYILFVGRFVEKKGATHLIDAMRLLESRGSTVRLMLIGDGRLGQALRDQARGLKRVVFLGWLPHAEVRRRMRGALALCVPSVTGRDGDAEGLPTVIFEAMAEGAPVVGSRHAGIAEAVEHGRTGLLVPEGDTPALADALERMVACPELRRRLGTAARAVAAERFSAIGQSRRLESALLRVAGERP
jgi:colanic acid/amylovoran biosynthesis glycosyltransferase